MGEVYEAEDSETGRRMAIKLMAHPLASEDDRARFLREGRLAASINHPNSVYIFGTDEIDGVPVIAMELSAEGTLQERVNARGPMDPSEAADAILQLIDGLEAALEQGVLHRDIKPSNCFADTDGRVKIGDYGLSISTVAGETMLTMAGTIIGTPAFSSPEQLRGQDLDVRSDIYSVGATLYYLLTGRPPFEEKGVVNLLAAVLEREPVSPRAIRKDIPKGLVSIVLRCLARQSGSRFVSYAELREALRTFSSARARPASLPWRALAQLLDGVPVGLATSALGVMSLDLETAMVPMLFLSTGAMWLYFTLSEGIWGASLGKFLCGLRVLGPDRGVPGLKRAAARAGIYTGIPTLVGLLPVFIAGEATMSLTEPDPAGALRFSGHGVTTLLLFVGARHRNGFAGLHDWISGTRVVEKPKTVLRPAVESAVKTVGMESSSEQIGPYVVTGVLSEAPEGTIVTGYDPRLQRPVWIRRVSADAPRQSETRRDLARVGRLRWLSGRREQGNSWDAYAVPAGRPMAEVLKGRSDWGTARHWVADLLAEFRDATSDGTLPEVLSVRHLWMGDDGRLRLLDFPVFETGDDLGEVDLTDLKAVQQFVSRFVARAAAPEEALENTGIPEIPIPLRATHYLETLRDSGFQSFDALIEGIRPLLESRAVVSRAVRAGQILTCLIFPLFMFLPVGIFVAYRLQQHVIEYPDFAQLDRHLRRLNRIQTGATTVDTLADVQTLEMFVAGEYRNLLTDPTGWPEDFPVPDQVVELGRELMDRYPEVTAAELAEIRSSLTPYLEAREREYVHRTSSVFVFLLVLEGTAGVLVLVAAAGTVFAFLFRGGALFRLFRIAVVRPDGREASRWRTLFRGVIAWSPFALWIPYIRLTGYYLADYGYMVAELMILGLGMFLLSVGLLWAVWRPERCLQDRIAGTYLVPR